MTEYEGPLSAAYLGCDDQAMMAGIIRLAIERVDADPNAGTSNYSHTMQTRRSVAALRALGVKRSDFRARTPREANGEYGHCHVSVWTKDAEAIIERNARALADNGFSVWVGRVVFMTTQSPRGRVVRFGAEGSFITEYEEVR